MEQRLNGVLEAQAGLQNQLSTVNATLMALPMSIAAVIVGNNAPSGDTSRLQVIIMRSDTQSKFIEPGKSKAI